MEAEARRAAPSSSLQIGPRRFQQTQRADDVRLDEGGRAVDRAIDMALGGKMHHGVGPEVAERRRHRRRVADVHAGSVARILDRSERVEVAA